eukprot:TRINITY_DN2990_c0_g1_i2.p1 TRINITY_DN2990_c0_g1~~TRINITY_DN2990_c0_g1_i2.p1  ORF type:complete len:240 (+),score=50.60 TRINITY_DN2990_c0_g1_i2:158-877(+)
MLKISGLQNLAIKIEQKMSLLSRHWQLSNEPQNNELTFMQFNMLSSELEDAFPRADPEVLKWSYRKKGVLEVISQFDVDVIAVEECDRSEEVLMFMEERGYHGIFQKKINERSDGTLLMWKASKFELIENTYARLGENASSTVLMVKLMDLGQQKPFVVAATHLKAKPGFEEVRKSQVIVLLRELESFNSENHPVVVLGDFNDIPGSLMYQEMENKLEISSQFTQLLLLTTQSRFMDNL